MPEVVRARNGAMVRLAPGPAEIIDDVPAGPPLQGRRHRHRHAAIAPSPERRKLAFAGIVSVAIAIDERGEIAGDPVIDIMGLPEKTRQGESIPDLVADTVGRRLTPRRRPKRRDPGSASRTPSSGRSAAR